MCIDKQTRRLTTILVMLLGTIVTLANPFGHGYAPSTVAAKGVVLAPAGQEDAASITIDPQIVPIEADVEYQAVGTKRVHAVLSLSPAIEDDSDASFRISISSTLPISTLLPTVTVSLLRKTAQVEEQIELDVATVPPLGEGSSNDADDRIVRWQTSVMSTTLTLLVGIEATTNEVTNEEWTVKLSGLPADPTTIVTIAVQRNPIAEAQATAAEDSDEAQVTSIEVDPVVKVDQATYSIVGGSISPITVSGYGKRNVYPSTGDVCNEIALKWQAPDAASAASNTTTLVLFRAGVAVCGASRDIAVAELADGTIASYTLQGTAGEFSAEAHALVELVPAPIPFNEESTRPVAISAGYDYTCAVTVSGEVFCWGSDRWGELGDGTTGDANGLRLRPVKVEGLISGIKAVDTGETHTCAVTIAGAAVCWGNNSYGAVGNGEVSAPDSEEDLLVLEPSPVVGLQSDVEAIGAGSDFTCALTTAGAVKCWGWNLWGQVGNDHEGIPCVNDFHICSPVPVDVIGLQSNVQAISVGRIHACALKTNSEVWCWGGNGYRQMGDATGGGGEDIRPIASQVVLAENDVRAISAGWDHTCALNGAGEVDCWGLNDTGQLGEGGGGIQCGAPDGSQECSMTPYEVQDLDVEVQAISAGWHHTCVLTVQGGVKCWGGTRFGEIGDATNGDENNLRLSPTDVYGLPSGVTAISAANYHTCALTTEGTVMCWGRNSRGEVGDDTTITRFRPVNTIWP